MAWDPISGSSCQVEVLVKLGLVVMSMNVAVGMCVLCSVHGP